MDAEHRKPQATNATDGPVRPRWPARTQRLLNVIGPQCAQWLEPALQQCLDRFDKELYQMAEHARSHASQQQYIDSRAQLQMQRPAFMQAYANHLRDGFAHLGEVEEGAGASSVHQPLRLLERSEHELVAALEKLAARGEAHHGQLLTELSYRFAVLVGAAPLEGKALPIGPAGLADALRIAIGTLDLPSEHRQLLLQNFEQALIVAAEPLYTVVNALLLDDGLLPQLRPYAPPRTTPGARSAAAETPAAAAVAGSESPGAPQAPITVLETLRDLLSQRRTAGGGGVVAGQAASPEELQTALGALQQHLAQVTDNASRELRSAQRLREELLLQLNAGKPAGAAPTQLSPEQDDTVELVAMLFEQIGKQLHEGQHAHSVLGDLQLPMLRLAVTDRDFFDKREHPARRLLGVVADAANDWLDGTDGDADQQLTVRLNQLVERARKEPPSAGLYTSLLADIEHHLAQLNRRAQASERRHVEAMQGRERLDLARHRANELLAERYAQNPPRGLLRTLLDRAWSDVLALAVLQHGEDSPAFAQRLRVTDELLGRLPTDDPGLLRLEVQAGLQQIGMHAEEASQVALRLIGEGEIEPIAAPPRSTPPTTTAASAAMPSAVIPSSPDGVAAAGSAPIAEAPAPAAVAPVVTAAPPAAAELPSATDLALRLKQRQRLGESPQGKPAPAHDDDKEPPLGPQEARIHNRLRQLPYGSWFEFTDLDTGKTSRRKLAWFSPVTGKSLFITRRGQRSEEMNLRELARAMTSGAVRELPQQSDGLLDRAWHSLTGSLLRNAKPSSAKTPGARP
ncbi:DUF1631 family protein [Rhodanobacter sp. 7MK24]|uniref:DUF1631 family protein n=1 Tax=Rhodanobacter sp. 7MK24 TaxID=2775922 RepID=UPI001787648E|nr:DUF1631 family protein [Rhodanobacter sp. 7MK24]MBD8881082.1 DUF1631 family protein [Rhodanobacter sp. 7MK24]